MSTFMTPLFIAVGAIFLIIVFLIMVSRLIKMVVKVPPNEALLVYGIRTKTHVAVLKRVPLDVPVGEAPRFTTKKEDVVVNYKIVKGGWTFVFPPIHTTKKLDLSLKTLDLEVKNVLSAQAVPITVDGIAQIKIGSDDTYIATAAEQLLDKNPEDIEKSAKETLMGHFRAIVGLMTVEQVYKDREEFSRRVQEVAIDDLAGMGFEIKSFVIKDISDEKDYIKSLGAKEIQEKLKLARIATAEAERDAVLQEQLALKARAEATKNTDVARQAFAAEVATETAKAERAEAISLAEQDKTLEIQKAIAAEQMANRVDKELDATTRRPADADLYAAQKKAEATLYTAERTAEASLITAQKGAEGNRTQGFAAADVTRKTGEAAADAEKAQGLAKASVIQAQLVAEAEGKQKLVEALNQYGPNALKLLLGQQFLAGLPVFADNITKHLSEIDEVRLVDLGGGGDGKQPVLEQYADQALRILTKLLQGAPALVGGPLDDILAAFVASLAEKAGVEKKEESVEPEEEKNVEEVPPEKLEVVETPAEEAPTIPIFVSEIVESKPKRPPRRKKE